MIKNGPYKLGKEKIDILYANSKMKDDEIYKFLQKKKKAINRYPNVIALGQKDQFQDMMNIGGYFDDEAFDFVPRTFIFPQERERFIKYQSKHKDAMFIGKPQKGAKGDKIVLFNDLRQVPFTLEDNMVVQRYIQKPLLIDKLKFDLRMYVVIMGIEEGETKAFLADEGLARFCTMNY